MCHYNEISTENLLRINFHKNHYLRIYTYSYHFVFIIDFTKLNKPIKKNKERLNLAMRDLSRDKPLNPNSHLIFLREMVIESGMMSAKNFIINVQHMNI